jgi:hypothetical protein
VAVEALPQVPQCHEPLVQALVALEALRVSKSHELQARVALEDEFQVQEAGTELLVALEVGALAVAQRVPLLRHQIQNQHLLTLKPLQVHLGRCRMREVVLVAIPASEGMEFPLWLNRHSLVQEMSCCQYS